MTLPNGKTFEYLDRVKTILERLRVVENVSCFEITAFFQAL